MDANHPNVRRAQKKDLIYGNHQRSVRTGLHNLYNARGGYLQFVQLLDAVHRFLQKYWPKILKYAAKHKIKITIKMLSGI